MTKPRNCQILTLFFSIYSMVSHVAVHSVMQSTSSNQAIQLDDDSAIRKVQVFRPSAGIITTRDTSGFSQLTFQHFLVLFFSIRPSARRGLKFTLGRHLRSKRRCSCVLQFTRLHAVSCVLHRPTSRVIHHSRFLFIFYSFLFNTVSKQTGFFALFQVAQNPVFRLEIRQGIIPTYSRDRKQVGCPARRQWPDKDLR